MRALLLTATKGAITARRGCEQLFTEIWAEIINSFHSLVDSHEMERSGLRVMRHRCRGTEGKAHGKLPAGDVSSGLSSGTGGSDYFYLSFCQELAAQT